jgi:hypothetical protein
MRQSKDRKANRSPQTTDEAAPIVLPARTAVWTYGDHLKHLAEHAGTLPPTLDEFGRCVVCVHFGWFRLNA